jgi:hypothetical protein
MWATVQTFKLISATRNCTPGIVDGDQPKREEERMKYLTIFCLSLGLAGCYGAGPYASAGVSGPVVDLGACAHSPLPTTRIDQLCNRQDANPYGSN